MRKKLFIIISSGIAVFIIIVLLIIFSTKKESGVGGENQNINAAAETAATAALDLTNIAIIPAGVESGLKADLIRVASSFVERFGSFSNQSNFANLEDLKDSMTAKMRAATDKYIADSKAREKNSAVYYGITTKVLNTNVTSFAPDDSSAEILISTQRQEATKTTTNTRVYYQDILVKLLKEEGIWKIDEAVWK